MGRPRTVFSEHSIPTGDLVDCLSYGFKGFVQMTHGFAFDEDRNLAVFQLALSCPCCRREDVVGGES